MSGNYSFNVVYLSEICILNCTSMMCCKGYELFELVEFLVQQLLVCSTNPARSDIQDGMPVRALDDMHEISIEL